jgi:hypothetical protein
VALPGLLARVQGRSQTHEQTPGEPAEVTRPRDKCGKCGTLGPEARSTHTLTRTGWRIDIQYDAKGHPLVTWLCPKCWEEKTGTAPLQGSRPPPKPR